MRKSRERVEEDMQQMASCHNQTQAAAVSLAAYGHLLNLWAKVVLQLSTLVTWHRWRSWHVKVEENHVGFYWHFKHISTRAQRFPDDTETCCKNLKKWLWAIILFQVSTSSAPISPLMWKFWWNNGTYHHQSDGAVVASSMWQAKYQSGNSQGPQLKAKNNKQVGDSILTVSMF